MAFGNDSSDDLDLVVKIELDETITKLEKLKAKLDETGKSGEEPFSKAQANVIAFNQSLQLAERSITLTTDVFKKMFQALKHGAEVNDVSDSFANLAKQAGSVASVLTDQLASASAKTISSFDLQKKGIELLRAQMKPNEIVALTKAARAFAEEGGDLREELDALSRSYLSGSDKWLKLRGVVIDNAAAQDRFAKKLGTTAENLSEAGKLAAVQAAMMDTFNSKAKEADSIQSDVGDSFDKLLTSVQNWGSGLVSSISSNENFARGLKWCADNFDSLIEILPSASAMMDWWAKTSIAAINPVISEISDFIRGVNVLNNMMKGISTQEAIESQAQIELAESTIEAANARKESREQIQTTTTATQAETKATKEQGESLKALREKYLDNAKIQKAAEEAGKSAMERLQKHAALLEKEAAEYKKANSPDGIEGYRDQLIKLVEQQQSGVIPSMGQLIEKLAEARAAYEALGGSAQNAAIGERAAAVEVAKRGETDSFGNSLQGGLFGSSAESNAAQGGAIAADAINIAVHDAIVAGLEGTANSKDWKEIGVSLGSSIGEAIGTSIGGPLGGAIGSALGEVFSEKIFDKLMGHSQGSQDRKAVDAYFAEIFDSKRLSIVVGDQVKAMHDMVFNGDTLFGGVGVDLGNGPSNQFLGTLPAQVQAAFQAAGTAFEELLGVSEDFQGYLSGVLANNLGDLFNLRLALEATGKSVEDMDNALKKAFEEGKISAQEYLSQLMEINSLMSSKGIPDKIGAVGEAFNNIFASGWKGGKTLLASLQAVGVEAQELGLSTMPQLAQVMESTFGISADKIDMFMKAMAASGIKSVAELVNASEEQLAALAANMEAISKGQSPTYTAPSSSAASAAASNAANRAQQAAENRKRRQQQFNSELEALISGSSRYELIIQRLNDGTISNSQATKQLHSLYDSGASILRKLAAAEEAAAKEIAKSGYVSAETAKKIEKLKESKESLTGESSSAVDVNKNLLDFLSEFRNNVDLVRVAADAAGISFQQMNNQAVNAFLNGSMSAADAAAKILGNTPGIAGKTGAVGEAWGKFKSYGTGGGRLTVDALRGLGFEGKELGGTSIDDLMKSMIAQGVSAEEAQKLFSELQAAGVTTLDQLSSVSNETAIKIINDLDSAQIPFQKTSAEVKKLLDDMSKLEEGTTIPIDLKDVTDPKFRALLEAVLGGKLKISATGSAYSKGAPGMTPYVQ